MSPQSALFQPPSEAPQRLSSDCVLDFAREALQREAQAIEATAQALDFHFSRILMQVETTIQAGHKLIFSGLGKNAPIAQKLVGTFNSLGAPSCFLDPTQALHGDLGLCVPGDLAFLISNSGETLQLIELAPLLQRRGLWTVAFSRKGASRLSEICDQTLAYVVPQEACPLQLVPTASTTACLALGDALAMAYWRRSGRGAEYFASLHPAGNLGRALVPVESLMRRGSAFAKGEPGLSVQEALDLISRSRSGLIAVVDPQNGQLVGVFTDGDLRRCALQDAQFLSKPLRAVMSHDPKWVRAGTLVRQAAELFGQHRVNELVVVDAQHRPLGVLDVQDLPRL